MRQRHGDGTPAYAGRIPALLPRPAYRPGQDLSQRRQPCSTERPVDSELGSLTAQRATPMPCEVRNERTANLAA